MELSKRWLPLRFTLPCPTPRISYNSAHRRCEDGQEDPAMGPAWICVQLGGNLFVLSCLPSLPHSLFPSLLHPGIALPYALAHKLFPHLCFLGKLG